MPFYTRLKFRGGRDTEQRKRTVKGLEKLRKGLQKHFTDQGSVTDRTGTVRIGTWNLREFGGNKHGGRDYEPLYYIAEIISHFDIVALQEVREDLQEFRSLLKILGPDWDFLATDVTEGSSGNGERMVFLFNRHKAFFLNIAGELTLPSGHKVLASFGERVRLSNSCTLVMPEGTDLSGDYKARTATKSGKIKLDQDLEIPIPNGSSLKLPEGCSLAVQKNSVIERPKNGVARVKISTPEVHSTQTQKYSLRLPGGSLDDSFKQFARTPYIVSFQSGWLKINLCTVHIYFGDNIDPALLEQRRGEIQALTKALGERAEDESEDDPNNTTMLGVLGDFNIIDHEHETMQALESNGFIVPDELKQIPGSNVEKNKAYDQIAFWEPAADRGYAKLEIVAAGVFDYYRHVFRTDEEAIYKPLMGTTKTGYGQWRTYKMSDHLPMWVEIRNNFSDEYLKMCEESGGT